MSSDLTPKTKKTHHISASKKNSKINNQELIQNDSEFKHMDNQMILTPPSSTITHDTQSPPISSKLTDNFYDSETELLESKCLKFSSDLDELSSKIKVFQII